ncbi:MAG: hypothetical protein JRG91_14845 [Deltaproteobacteria bacterium]|nr:hypothetical protein [Deltaproteobacteria bacterium]
MRLPVALVLAALLTSPDAAAGGEDVTVTWLPGAARTIPRTDSASRDAPVFEYAYGPAAYDTIGGEWGWLLVSGKGLTFHLGQYAMLPMENHDSKRLFPPGQLWRGMTGGSVSLSLDSLAHSWFGTSGAFEISITVSHESDHGDLDDPPGPTDIPKGGGGQAVCPDVAIRVPITNEFTLIARIQDRIYMSGALIHAPGVDLILRYALSERLVPQIAIFGEGIFPRKDSARNGFLVRLMMGLVIPGKIGEATFFWAADYGNGKGLLINHREFRMSGGIRYSPFSW